jgi:hypothetical protein
MELKGILEELESLLYLDLLGSIDLLVDDVVGLDVDGREGDLCRSASVVSKRPSVGPRARGQPGQVHTILGKRSRDIAYDALRNVVYGLRTGRPR